MGNWHWLWPALWAWVSHPWTSDDDIYIYIYICMYVCIYIYIYICIPIPVHTGVCEYNTPFVQALALQSSSRNCNPAPVLVFWKQISPPVFLSRGRFYHRHRYGLESAPSAKAKRRAAPVETEKERQREKEREKEKERGGGGKSTPNSPGEEAAFRNNLGCRRCYRGKRASTVLQCFTAGRVCRASLLKLS